MLGELISTRGFVAPVQVKSVGGSSLLPQGSKPWQDVEEQRELIYVITQRERLPAPIIPLFDQFYSRIVGYPFLEKVYFYEEEGFYCFLTVIRTSKREDRQLIYKAEQEAAIEFPDVPVFFQLVDVGDVKTNVEEVLPQGAIAALIKVRSLPSRLELPLFPVYVGEGASTRESTLNYAQSALGSYTEPRRLMVQWPMEAQSLTEDKEYSLSSSLS